MFYDQDNDNSDITDREIRIHGDFLVGWEIARRVVCDGKTPANKRHLYNTIDKFGRYVGDGFEAGGGYYNDDHLDLGSPSEELWEEFDETE